MKKTVLIPSFVFLLLCASVGHTQIQSFEFAQDLTNSLTVPSGKIIRIHSLIGASSWGHSEAYSASAALAPSTNGISIQLSSGRKFSISPFNVSVGGGGNYIASSITSSLNSIVPGAPLILPGPITISRNGSVPMLLLYEILDNVGSSSSTQTPSQGSSVVVPTSAAGDVDVKMEQSADNVTWTECLPGTYNSSTVKRFFRLRAVEK